MIQKMISRIDFETTISDRFWNDDFIWNKNLYVTRLQLQPMGICSLKIHLTICCLIDPSFIFGGVSWKAKGIWTARQVPVEQRPHCLAKLSLCPLISEWFSTKKSAFICSLCTSYASQYDPFPSQECPLAQACSRMVQFCVMHATDWLLIVVLLGDDTHNQGQHKLVLQ